MISDGYVLGYGPRGVVVLQWSDVNGLETQMSVGCIAWSCSWNTCLCGQVAIVSQSGVIGRFTSSFSGATRFQRSVAPALSANAELGRREFLQPPILAFLLTDLFRCSKKSFWLALRFSRTTRTDRQHRSTLQSCWWNRSLEASLKLYANRKRALSVPSNNLWWRSWGL